MTQSAIPAAIMGRDPEEIRAALVADLVPVIADSVDPQTYDPRELGSSGGNVWKAVIWQERIWYRNEESVADHDEITCIRLADGVAYLTNDTKFVGWVLSRSLAVPPDESDSPGVAIGDQFRIADAAEGEWAGHENEVTIYTARGWKFHVPQPGELHYVVDETGYEHFNAASEWEDGLGALVYQSAVVRPDNLLIRAWSVEDQTTNAPPTTGPAGEQYIIGGSPTGDWAGHAKKIAWRPATDADFIVTAPFPGEEVYDKDLGIKFRWNTLASAWQSAAGAVVDYQTAFTQGNGSVGVAGGSLYTYSSSVAPTTGAYRLVDNTLINKAARRSGATLRIEYQCVFNGATTVVNPAAGTDTPICLGLFRDSETSAIDWTMIANPGSTDIDPDGSFSHEFVVSAPDINSHTYFVAVIAFRRNSISRILVPSVERRRLTIMEIG